MKKYFIGFVLGFIFSLILFVLTPSSHAEDYSHRAYKEYLSQILVAMKEANVHLEQIELNTKAVKDKLHA